ncbi:hypothetical protein [Terrisporobacter petrolearius]|uniref:hypothetical protein n=1 Tax=Terrisporobacter petrolearius TaxID=1460447 RepID=UPI003B00585E
MSIKDFNLEIDRYIEGYPKNSAILSKIKQRINELQDKLEEECSLVFIADKGAGKTTAIDFILGLIVEREKINKKNGRKYIVEEDVLETGSGATTISEVEITQSEAKTSKIIIEPYEEDEIVDILSNFASTIFKNTHNLELNEGGAVPTELLRACRNMTRLTEKAINEEKIDLARELALQYDPDKFEDFKNMVISLANLDQRTKIEFEFDNKEKSEKIWIKKMFKKLNLVSIKDAPLPSKIIVKLSKYIFDFSLLNRVNKIIDTRGLEAGSNTDRSDLKRLFRNGENNIILFVDKFNSPSKSIIDLMDHYVYDREMECINRIGYIVNFRDGEPDRVINFEGKVESEIDGINEKYNQVVQIFKDESVRILEENIVYCNPRRFLDEEGKIVILEDDLDEFDYNRNDIINHKKSIRLEERNKFESEIINLITEYDIKLSEETDQLMEVYNNIKTDIDKNSKLDVSHICEYIIEQKIEYNLEEIITQIYDDYISSKFPSTLMAINNRHGIYNYYDIYCEGANFIETNIKVKLKKIKDVVILELDNIYQNSNLNKNQKSSLEFIKKDINKYFFKYIEVINRYFYDKLKEEVYSKDNNIFWDKVKSRWGKGSGYRNEIVKYYKENIVVQNFNREINDEIKNLAGTFKVGLFDILNK